MAVNESYLKEFVTDRQQFYSALHKQIKAGRDLRFRRHKINIPVAYRATTTEIKSSIVLDMYYRVVATLTTDEPTLTVPPYSQTQKAKDNSNLRERFTSGAMDQMMSEAGRDTLRMGVGSAVGDGLGAWKLIERKDAWKGFPRRSAEETFDDSLSVEDNTKRANAYTERADKFTKSSPFPFTWTDLDVTTYLPLVGPYGVEEVVELTKRPALPTMKQFGVYKPSGGKGFAKRRLGQALTDDDNYANQTFDMVEHWTSSGVTYELDNEIVEQRTLNYGRVPYFHFGGHMTNSRRPEEQYQSVTQPFAHLIPALDSMMSMMTNWAFFAAYPFIVQDPNEQPIMGPKDPAKTVLDITPGSVLRGVRFLEAPQTSKALADMIELLRIMIDKSGLAAVMYGAGASSSSGYMVSQLMTAAQLVYSPIVKEVRMALEAMIPFLWRLIEKQKGRTCYVWGNGTSRGQQEWLGLGPEDIDGYYAIKVSLKPLLPMDKISQRSSIMQIVQGEIPLMSQRTGMEELGIEQPEEEVDQILTEKLLRSPKYLETMMQRAGEKAGLVEPEPPAPLQPPQGPPMGPPGMEQGGPPPGFPGLMPPGMLGNQPQVPGVNLPLVPPIPTNAGMPEILGRPSGPRQSGPGAI